MVGQFFGANPRQMSSLSANVAFLFCGDIYSEGVIAVNDLQVPWEFLIFVHIYIQFTEITYDVGELFDPVTVYR